MLKNVASGPLSSVAFSDAQLQAVIKIGLDWPEDFRFPGLDLLRLMVLLSPQLYQGPHANIPQALATSVIPASDDGTLSKEQQVNLMLALRFFANMFAQKEGIELAAGMSEKVYCPGAFALAAKVLILTSRSCLAAGKPCATWIQRAGE
jgi:phospholipase A-2-activating protein